MKYYVSEPIVPMMSVRNQNLSDEPSESSNDNQDVNIWSQNNPMYKGEIKTDGKKTLIYN